MMKGYDKEEAAAYIVSHIPMKDHAEFADKIEDLICQAIDADMEYMHSACVIDEQGGPGDAYYDDDDAFEFIVEKLAEANGFGAEKAIRMASLIDDYMEQQEAYLEKKGLVDWA